MKMREDLNATEWGRIRAYCGSMTEEQLLRLHAGRLSLALDSVARGKDPRTASTSRLTSAAVSTALRFCATVAPTPGGESEEIQG